MQLSKVLKIPGYYLGIHLKIALKKRTGIQCVGITNKTGHKYVPFFDYDISEYKLVTTEITELQKAHDLGNAHIFKTGNGFHVIMTDLLTYREWVNILMQSTADTAYKTISQVNNKKTWVLRISEKNNQKPLYITTLKNKSNKIKSQSHTHMLKLLGVPPQNLQTTPSTHYAPSYLATYPA